MNIEKTVEKLIGKGVRIPNPFSVEIGEEVDPDNISADGICLYGGTRISGAKTVIMPGVKLGEEGPVVLNNCQLGENVELKGGCFTDSVFLARTSMASGAHVRENCLLEEEVKTGHTVGLKQTILFPFVTLGSLINFCDIFMAGGTSRKDHSEVGSSFIHFNYTPNQDKATASLLGDVPRGVMLRAAPLFLGGQGGIIGPARLGYGTVIAAGAVWSGDCPEGGKLLLGRGNQTPVKDFHPGLYADIRRRVINNILYYANIMALQQWYLYVRSMFSGYAPRGDLLLEGAQEVLKGAATERMARFRILAEKMNRSIELGKVFLPESRRNAMLDGQREFRDRWQELEWILTSPGKESACEGIRDAFLADLDRAKKSYGNNYLTVINALDNEATVRGTQWMQTIVDDATNRALTALPFFNL